MCVRGGEGEWGFGWGVKAGVETCISSAVMKVSTTTGGVRFGNTLSSASAALPLR